MAKSMLIISRQAPWAGMSAREALDAALAGGAFDLPIALLFMEDGVFQLTSSQQPSRLEQKDTSANLQALSLFGIEHLYASKVSLIERGMETHALHLPVKVLTSEEIRSLLRTYDLVVTL
ncbi:tRNA 2-thiouridine synthesizing protein C [Pseudomonas duriflava]|uniref:tRNA 2-thiouridine synthesizing protein C n=1 Tax=Pseudomonas duriflava TaxID=459528 RepID=A0A562Q1E0_9PSED|nr:sulfurtransferase complex subunit TusC [Pseudomonas duriflava]TWI50458.1 tRNA 2-thiouridine synthesizing protein C [Pseudomonas duriflava]